MDTTEQLNSKIKVSPCPSPWSSDLSWGWHLESLHTISQTRRKQTLTGKGKSKHKNFTHSQLLGVL